MAKSSPRSCKRTDVSKPVLTVRRKKKGKAARVAIESPDGKKDVIEVPREIYESLRETAGVMASPELMEAIAAARKQIAAGRTVVWEDIEAELTWRM